MLLIIALSKGTYIIHKTKRNKFPYNENNKNKQVSTFLECEYVNINQNE